MLGPELTSEQDVYDTFACYITGRPNKLGNKVSSAVPFTCSHQQLTFVPQCWYERLVTSTLLAPCCLHWPSVLQYVFLGLPVLTFLTQV